MINLVKLINGATFLSDKYEGLNLCGKKINLAQYNVRLKWKMNRLKKHMMKLTKT